VDSAVTWYHDILQRQSQHSVPFSRHPLGSTFWPMSNPGKVRIALLVIEKWNIKIFAVFESFVYRMPQTGLFREVAKTPVIRALNSWAQLPFWKNK
jgi:hypothetical protein